MKCFPVKVAEKSNRSFSIYLMNQLKNLIDCVNM